MDEAPTEGRGEMGKGRSQRCFLFLFHVADVSVLSKVNASARRPLFFGVRLRLLVRGSNFYLMSEMGKTASYLHVHGLALVCHFSWSEVTFYTLGLMKIGRAI